MELIKESINIGKSILEGSTQVMAEGDICVPEIKPDMLKVLQIDAVSCITGTEITDGKLCVTGRINVTVLYVPDRENEKIRSMQTAFDFSQKIENANIANGMEAIVSSNVERLEFSAINSRKLHIKAIVGIDYEIISLTQTEISGGTSSESAQIKTKSLQISNITGIERSGFNLKESIEIPSGQESINEILKTDIKISDAEYKTLTGKVVLKGTACICVLYTDAKCNIEFTEAEIPFTEVIDADIVTEETFCDVDYCIMDISGTTAEDIDGDMRIINVEAEIVVSIKSSENTEIEIMTDCYEPFKKTNVKYDEIVFEEISERPSMQNTLREIIEFSSDAPDVTGVYNVVARPTVDKAGMQNGKIVCEGKVETYILYLSDSKENPIYSMKKNIPFSYMMDCETSDSSIEPAIKSEIKHVSYNLNAAGELELRCILTLNANISKKYKMEIISDTEESDMETKSGIVVYFVRNGDNLWDMAKHYSVPQQEIIRLNNLEDEELKPGMKLFIPVCK